MEEKEREKAFCYNLKVSDPQCHSCLWLEWNPRDSSCKNRKKIICSLYADEVFGALGSKAIN